MIAKFLSMLAKVIWIKELGLLNGVVLIVSIYVHEYGHYFMADALKLKPKHPRFIPFLGAYVMYDETYDNKKLFKVAVSGPLLGGVLGVISFYINLIYPNDLFYQLALYSLLLNLINLIPFSILDGAHIIEALQFNKLYLLFSIILVILAIYTEIYMMIVLGVLGFIKYIYTGSIKDKLKPMNEDDKSFGIFVYFGLIVVLGIHLYFLLN